MKTLIGVALAGLLAGCSGQTSSLTTSTTPESQVQTKTPTKPSSHNDDDTHTMMGAQPCPGDVPPGYTCTVIE